MTADPHRPHPHRYVLRALLALAVGCGAGCPRRSTESAERGASGEHRRFGDVMTEVGRRFERCGRAAAAGRWELADYDVGEIGEAFEQDVPHARLPPELHVDLQPLVHSFAVTYPDELHRAIAGRDRHAFDVAFARTAAACNACHAAANKAYIEVPSTLGTEVPVIEHAAPTENPDAGGTFAPALR